MREPSLRPLVGLSLALLLGACTNGGKNQRDTTGMTPGSAAGQLGGAGASTGAAPAAPLAPPAASADSLSSRRDTLGGRMSRMMRRTRRDSVDCANRNPNCRRP